MKAAQFVILIVLSLLATSCGGGGGGSDDGTTSSSGLAELSAAQTNLEEVTGGVELTLLVSNTGDADSAACFGTWSAVSLDGTSTYITDTVTIPSIVAGGSYSWVINVSLSSVPGDQTNAHFYIVHFVDSTEIVPEVDDDNNQEASEVDAAALPDAIKAPG